MLFSHDLTEQPDWEGFSPDPHNKGTSDSQASLCASVKGPVTLPSGHFGFCREVTYLVNKPGNFSAQKTFPPPPPSVQDHPIKNQSAPK